MLIPGGTEERLALARRLVAERCLYGVDLNPLAVDLARLSLWVHSFVPGLPLALLDDHLVQGNALVGVATVRQLEERFAAAGTLLFPVDAKSLLGPAEEPLRRRARLMDTTIADVERARDAMREAKAALGPTKALSTSWSASRSRRIVCCSSSRPGPRSSRASRGTRH